MIWFRYFCLIEKEAGIGGVSVIQIHLKKKLWLGLSPWNSYASFVSFLLAPSPLSTNVPYSIQDCSRSLVLVETGKLDAWEVLIEPVLHSWFAWKGPVLRREKFQSSHSLVWAFVTSNQAICLWQPWHLKCWTFFFSQSCAVSHVVGTHETAVNLDLYLTWLVYWLLSLPLSLP